MAQRSLAEWCRYVDSTYQVAPHHAKLIQKLEQVERREIHRLIVSMPPRHGKSLTTTIRFPAWFLGRHPDERVICASHTASLAYSFSRRCRNELAEYGERTFDVRIADDSAAVDRWEIAGRRGGLVAAGVGGPLTGQGADLLVIDDPIKDAEAAHSAAQRASVLEWWRTVGRTRLHPAGAVVLVMTRWHHVDLAGVLMEEAKSGSEQWETLTLPMVDEAGRTLWPERYPAEEVEAIRKAVGTRAWESLYQQRPTPQEGELLKAGWWRYYEALPACETVLQSWDMAFKGTQDSDYVVGQVWGRRGEEYFLLDQVRGRWDFPRTCAEVEKLSAKWPSATLKLVEDKANGPAVLAQLRGKVSGLVAVEPQGGKEARAHAVAPLAEAGNVYLPSPQRAPWVTDFVAECSAFPFGAHDDQVDALSQALSRLSRMGGYVPQLSGQASGFWTAH